jgi:long-chain acyl-CoA synthetase
VAFFKKMLINEILEGAAREFPDKPAVWFKGVWQTYAEISSSADSVAAYLVSIGVQAGDRVAVLLENSFDYISAHFGIHKAGAVEVSLNTELKADEIMRLLSDCEARVLISESRKTHSFPGVRQVAINEIPPNIPVPCPKRIDIDLAAIVYTSGVTDRPKGVMLSHLNLVSNTRSIVQYLSLNPDDRMMVVLPFYYIYGRSLLYSHFLSGGSLVLDNSFAYPTKVLNAMQELDVTAFAGVPSTFAILLRKSDVASRKFPKLRMVTQAGGGMAPAMQKEAAEAFHPARLYVMYGSTEAAPRLSYVEPEKLQLKWGSIGRAIPNVELIVADQAGNRCPPDITGEIAARGSNIMMGYWKAPESTAQVMHNGYYFTGDLGYADEDGYIFLTGRSRDIIKSGGNRVSAKEIEDIIAEIPGVLESAVIGVQDEILGEAIKAFIIPSAPSLTEEQVKAILAARLPAFKLPKWVEFRANLPKNQSGKILKTMLRDKSSHEFHKL